MIRQASRDRDHLLPQAAGQWRGARHHVAHHVAARSEEHTSELQSQSNLVCRLLLEKKKNKPPACLIYKEPRPIGEAFFLAECDLRRIGSTQSIQTKSSCVDYITVPLLRSSDCSGI